MLIVHTLTFPKFLCKLHKRSPSAVAELNMQALLSCSSPLDSGKTLVHSCFRDSDYGHVQSQDGECMVSCFVSNPLPSKPPLPPAPQTLEIFWKKSTGWNPFLKMLKKGQEFWFTRCFLDVLPLFCNIFGYRIVSNFHSEGVTEKESKEVNWNLFILIRKRFFIFQGFATAVTLIVSN